MTTAPETAAPSTPDGAAALTTLADAWVADAKSHLEWHDEHHNRGDDTTARIARVRAEMATRHALQLRDALGLPHRRDTPRFVFPVPGDPIGQGRISYNRTGHGYHANGHILKPWRKKISAAAVDATGQHAYAPPPKLTRAQKTAGAKRPKQVCQVCQVPQNRHGVILGAVRIEVVVTFARPKSDPARPHPIGRNIGDWDHHGRSVSDALTGVVFADDAQIIDGRTVKTYPGGHPLALAEPGAVIRVWEAG